MKKYRIEYKGNRHCDFAANRAELLEIISEATFDEIADIRKLYKSGVSDSVIEEYKRYVGKGGAR